MIINWKDDGWRKRFAFFPLYLSDGPNKMVVWLQWVWKRDAGLYTRIELTDPRVSQESEG